mmetsp:Transcript_28213/g.74447  ORF Transcript_28213/g.74447 Transcript_28213/m.74447 type:complete len:202 (-) Transcript_28213:707-1312(-)
MSHSVGTEQGHSCLQPMGTRSSRDAGRIAASDQRCHSRHRITQTLAGQSQCSDRHSSQGPQIRILCGGTDEKNFAQVQREVTQSTPQEPVNTSVDQTFEGRRERGILGQETPSACLLFSVLRQPSEELLSFRTLDIQVECHDHGLCRALSNVLELMRDAFFQSRRDALDDSGAKAVGHSRPFPAQARQGNLQQAQLRHIAP